MEVAAQKGVSVHIAKNNIVLDGSMQSTITATILGLAAQEGFAFLILGNAQIMIDEIGIGRTWKTGELNYPYGRGINFQIKVEDVTSLAEKLKIHHVDLFLNIEEKCYQTDNTQVRQKQFLVMDGAKGVMEQLTHLRKKYNNNNKLYYRKIMKFISNAQTSIYNKVSYYFN